MSNLTGIGRAVQKDKKNPRVDSTNPSDIQVERITPREESRFNVRDADWTVIAIE